jgi:hypothetical protein
MITPNKLSQRTSHRSVALSANVSFWGWIPAAALLIGLASTFLWTRGWIYRSAYFSAAGLDVAQFPMGVQETIGFGAMPMLVYVVLLVYFSVIAFGAVYLAVAITPWRLYELIKQWLGQSYRLTVAIGIVSITLFLGGIFSLLAAAHDGRKQMKSVIDNYVAARCTSTAVNAKVRIVRVERAALGSDGKESLHIDEGNQLACSEKFCAVVRIQADGNWYTQMIPLDKLSRFDVFTRIHARPSC